jgi:hypothetical protein
MLESIRSFIDQDDVDDDTFVLIEQISWTGEDAQLQLAVRTPDQPNACSIWRIVGCGLRECHIEERFGEFEFHEDDHVLIRKHAEPICELFFNGKPRDAPGVVGRLWSAHEGVAKGWIPFGSYLNPEVELSELISLGFGMLARGPKFMIDAYSNVLGDAGMNPNPSAARSPKLRRNNAWVELAEPLAVLIIGTSFVVAESFEETELERRAG